MKIKILFFFLTFVCISSISSQTVKSIKAEELQKMISKTDNPPTIYNFWATWCKPCVKELPYFEKLNEREDLQVILVSVDFPNQKDRLTKFVEKENLKTPVYHINENDSEKYMNVVSSQWTGSIPASLFVNKDGDKFFYEKEFDKESLLNTVNTHFN